MGKPVEEILDRFEKEYKELQDNVVTCPNCKGTGVYRLRCQCGCGEFLINEACLPCNGDGTIEE